MKVGVFFIATADTVHPARFAAKAEQLGFESFWIGEHPVFPVNYKTRNFTRDDGVFPEFYGRVPNLFVSLAVASAVTTKIMLGTAVCLALEHHILDLAKTVATLDNLSGGRFGFGVGVGYVPEEAVLFGVTWPKRWALLRETIGAMRGLWEKGEAGYEGELVRFPPVRCIPQPVQRPLPVLVGGMSDKAKRAAARWGDGWMAGLSTSAKEFKVEIESVLKLAKEHGRDVSNFPTTVTIGINEASPARDMIRSYEDIGVDRVIVMFSEEPGSRALTTYRFFTPDRAERQLELIAEISL